MSGYPPNTQDSSGIYIGDNYAIDSSGGFAIQQSLPEIQLQDTSIARQFDVTDALQINYSVRRINTKIGVIKDENNENTLFTEFDLSNDTFFYRKASANKTKEDHALFTSPMRRWSNGTTCLKGAISSNYGCMTTPLVSVLVFD